MGDLLQASKRGGKTLFYCCAIEDACNGAGPKMKKKGLEDNQNIPHHRLTDANSFNQRSQLMAKSRLQVDFVNNVWSNQDHVQPLRIARDCFCVQYQSREVVTENKLLTVWPLQKECANLQAMAMTGFEKKWKILNMIHFPSLLFTKIFNYIVNRSIQ